MAKILDVEVINPATESVIDNGPEIVGIDAPEPEAAPAADPAPAAASEAAATAADPAAEAVYTPNRKFKFTGDDGEKEAEFEEWVGPLLNKENEEKFRELFSKAHGLDFVKSKRDKIAQEKASAENEIHQTRAELTEILGLREKDIGLFLKKVGVSEQQVAKWLLAKAEAQEKLKDLPEPLRNLYNENEELRRKNIDFEKQLAHAQGGTLEAATQALQMQAAAILNRPEISAIATEFDTRRGEPGAFFGMVQREGELEYNRSGRNLTAEEAVTRTLKTLALSIQAPGQGATPNGTVATPKVITAAKPAVIPNVGGGAAHTSGKKPRSIDELRKMAKEMSASNR